MTNWGRMIGTSLVWIFRFGLRGWTWTQLVWHSKLESRLVAGSISPCWSATSSKWIPFSRSARWMGAVNNVFFSWPFLYRSSGSAMKIVPISYMLVDNTTWGLSNIGSCFSDNPPLTRWLILSTFGETATWFVVHLYKGNPWILPPCHPDKFHIWRFPKMLGTLQIQIQN